MYQFQCSIMKCSTLFYFVPLYITLLSCNTANGDTEGNDTVDIHDLPKVEDTSDTELGRKTADLKKQAIKILRLRGVENLDEKVRTATDSNLY